MDAIIDLIPPKVAAYLPLDTSGYIYATGSDLIDVSKPSFWLSLYSIIFNPLYWNLVARNEYRKKTLTRMFGSNYAACYFLTVTIFSLGILRDALYERALRDQPHWEVLATPFVKGLAISLFVSGQIFVVTSIYALGLTGTYLGDYCGILMKERVTCFPFNVLEDPMYVGSTMAFVGTALWCESFAGLFLSALVWGVYSVALRFEGPFTGMIYSDAAKRKEQEAAAAAAAKGAGSKPSPKRATPTASTATSTATETAAPTATPRKSARKVAETPSNGATAATPRRKSSRKSLAADSAAQASPMRVTRSRSKARSGSETSD